ncbi:hypothetical protein ACJIZ3_015238 [Penstemon smallii]|uniref:O-fucosyltransferase family protein n=1 Tax=Penstemon smallii TaxID=265156 RepID=A0ABD3RM22_9LAMI
MSIMKKKKNRDELIGFQILQGLIICRHHQRRRRIRRLLPMLSAISGCLLLLFAVMSFLSPAIANPSRHLNTLMGGGSIGHDLWNSNQSNFFYGCSNASHEFLTAGMNTEPNRYLLIATSGGLNQQRTGIIDAVVAAYILNATLVIPKLDQYSFWKDTSNFSDIFDVEWFATSLSKDVKIIKQLPENVGKVITTRVPRKCDEQCYKTRILPLYIKKNVQAVELTKFDYRLSNRLDINLQKLRCRVNYHALRFTDPILEMGQKLVQRMRMKSKHFVALHLRFEPDMLAFSGCYYGGGEMEIKELSEIRKRWKNLHTKGPDKERRNGKCPLSPEEVGLMLRALGFGNDVHLYVASGEIYGGEETLAPLKALFPNFHTKETLASKEEMEEFSSYSARMAALDFIVCDESDVFVTNNNGNMAKILAGRRRYFGHKPTIRPNIKKLCRLFINQNNMTWEEFSSRVGTSQIGFMGEPNEVKPGSGVFHENPYSCICENSEAMEFGANKISKEDEDRSRGRYNGEVTDEVLSEEEQDLSELMEYTEYDYGFLKRV